MSKEYQFIIKEEKYSLSIIKRNKPINKNKIRGISIFKTTLEFNELNEDNINMILKKSNKKYIKSFANLGFITITNVICFAYVTTKDIEEVGFLSLGKIYKIKNINYIILDPDLNDKQKNNMQISLKEFVKSEINKGLYFSENVLNLSASFDQSYHYLYQYNPNIYHINQKYNFCYNYEYTAYFRKFSLDDFISNIMKGFYFQKTIKGKQSFDLIMHFIIRDKNFNIKEKKDINNNEEKNDIKYSLHELEIILSSNDYMQMFHFIFYIYFVNYFEYENKELINNLLKQEIPKNKKDNGSVIIFDITNKIEGKTNEEIINFIEELEKNLNKELGNNNKYIFIKNKEKINFEIEKNKHILEEIKFNYEYEGEKNNFQEKQLLLISNKGFNSLSIIENILSNLKYKFWNEQREIIYEKEIYFFVKEASKAYTNFIIQKNRNYQNIKEISSEPINQKYLDNKNFIKKLTFSEQLPNEYNIKNEIKNYNIIKGENEKNENQKKNNNLHIYIVTSNVNNYNLDINKNNDDLLKELLFPKEVQDFYSLNGYPEFYCIGLQEIVKLNTSNIVLFSGQNSANLWEIKISQLLQTNYNYTLQYKENLVGILLLIFVKATEAKNINSTKKSIKKSGFLNFFGNKGSLFYEFTYKNKNFSFCTGHLSAGANSKKLNERTKQLINILNHQNDKNSCKFYQNNFYFIFGDLNFRIKTSKKLFFNKVDEINSNYVSDNQTLEDKDFFLQVKKEIEKSEEERPKSSIFKKIDNMNYSDEEDDSDEDKKDIDKDKNKNPKNNIKKNRKINEEQFKLNFVNDFQKNDELNNLKPILEQYEIKENNISFLPTYKYYKGTNYYNVSKRVPAWTDRILFNKIDEIKCLFYDKIELKYSDHKAVYVLLEIDINNNNK